MKKIGDGAHIPKLISSMFHFIYYHQDKSWEKYTYMGYPILQNPMDLWLYQEIINETKPECIIVTGVAFGGMLLYFLNITQTFVGMSDTEVIGIDIELTKSAKNLIGTPHLHIIEGSSTDKKVIDKVNKIRKFKSAMVILDSDHKEPHVFRELELYSPMIRRKGCYLVVEDTNLNGHPVNPFWGPGPYEAVSRFSHTEQGTHFYADNDIWSKNLFTFHTWLKRI